MSKFKHLFDWINENGGFIHPNVITNEKNKLCVSENIGAKGVQLFVMPRKLCIDEGVYRNYKPTGYDELLNREKEIFDQPFFKLILNLISEKLKGKNSFYYQFIASLPQMEDLLKTHPIFYYNERKEEWKKILPTIIIKLDNLNDFYINLYLVITKLKIFDKVIQINKFPRYKTMDEVLKTIILWSFLVVNSYAIDNSYLMPLFNMVHYNHETDNKLLMDGNKINFSYDSIDNRDLVLNNGIMDNESLFVLHGYMNNNTKSFLEIKLSDRYTVEYEDSHMFIEETFKNNFDRLQQKYYITRDTPSISLVQYLRIVSLSPKDLLLIDKDDNKYFTKFVSMDNESGVYQKLLKIVKIKYDQIKQYNHKIGENDANDIVIIKNILKEEKDILKNMYYEIHKKWVNIMETEYDEDLLKDVFDLK